MFKISNEKYEEIANLILLLSTSNTFSYDLLRLMNRIIPFDCGLFLSPRQEWPDNITAYADIKETQKLLEQELFSANDPISELGSYVTGLNPFSDTEVFDIKTSPALDNAYRKELKRIGISHMLMLTIDRMGDGLRLMRSKSSAEFSEEEIEIAGYLSDALGYLYETQKKNQQLFVVAERHKMLNEMSPFGLFIFDSKYRLVECNTMGLARGADITGQNKTEDIVTQLLPYVKTMYTQIVFNKQTYSAVSVDNYILDLHVLQGGNQDENPFNYSVLYLFNKQWFKNAILSNSKVIAEHYGLTEREKSIFQLAIRGYSNERIASELFLSAFTVKDHLKSIYKKSGVKSRSELLAKTYTSEL